MAHPLPPYLLSCYGALERAGGTIGDALAEFDEDVEDPSVAVAAVRAALGGCWQPFWTHCLLLEEGAVHPLLGRCGLDAVSTVGTLQQHHQELLRAVVRTVPSAKPDLATMLGSARIVRAQLRVHLSQVDSKLRPLIERCVDARQRAALNEELATRATMTITAPPLDEVWARRAVAGSAPLRSGSAAP